MILLLIQEPQSRKVTYYNILQVPSLKTSQVELLYTPHLQSKYSHSFASCFRVQ